MTSYTAVTTCNEKQWQRYGCSMAKSFAWHWPIPLRVYAEGFTVDGADVPPFKVSGIDLDEAAPWLATWKRLYSDMRYRGGSDGRDYRHDAVRFAHKVAAIGTAAETADADVLIWIDADVVTFAPITEDWLASLFPEPAVVAWLDRNGTYPECGFLMFRLPAARRVIQDIVSAYRKGSIFKLQEWHDSFVIQHIVQRSGVPVCSLSGPQGRRHIGHPWVMSRLAERLDHLKGSLRKEAGRSSLGHDAKAVRSEPYWQKA